MNNKTTYLSIGANLGNRKKNIRAAFDLIQSFSDITAYSHAYRTKPYGIINQPDFINLAIEIKTDLNPNNLLINLKEIEKKIGRIPSQRWGQRHIDLDIIFYENMVVYTSDLIIPHPDMHNRDFVLRPMMDIAPNVRHPVLKMTVCELFENLNPIDK